MKTIGLWLVLLMCILPVLMRAEHTVFVASGEVTDIEKILNGKAGTGVVQYNSSSIALTFHFKEMHLSGVVEEVSPSEWVSTLSTVVQHGRRDHSVYLMSGPDGLPETRVEGRLVYDATYNKYTSRDITYTYVYDDRGITDEMSGCIDLKTKTFDWRFICQQQKDIDNLFKRRIYGTIEDTGKGYYLIHLNTENCSTLTIANFCKWWMTLNLQLS